MVIERVEADNEGESMERIKLAWNVNVPTLVTIIGAIISGAIYINKIDNRVDNNANHIAAIETTLSAVSDMPYRVKTLEADQSAQAEKDKAQDARLDRQSDLILSGQDSMRKTMQDGFDGMRKDIGTLSTKVEVIGSKVGLAQPSAFRPK